MQCCDKLICIKKNNHFEKDLTTRIKLLKNKSKEIVQPIMLPHLYYAKYKNEIEYENAKEHIENTENNDNNDAANLDEKEHIETEKGNAETTDNYDAASLDVRDMRRSLRLEIEEFDLKYNKKGFEEWKIYKKQESDEEILYNQEYGLF